MAIPSDGDVVGGMAFRKIAMAIFLPAMTPVSIEAKDHAKSPNLCPKPERRQADAPDKLVKSDSWNHNCR